MNFFTALFDKEDKSLSEQAKKTNKYQKKSFLGKIQRAKIKSKDDLLNLANLVAGQLSKEMDQGNFQLFSQDLSTVPLNPLFFLSRDVIDPLTQEKTSLQKGSEEEQKFYAKSRDLQPLIIKLNESLIQVQNQMGGQLLEVQKAMIRPTLNYIYKVTNTGLKGKNKSVYKQYGLSSDESKIIKKETNRIYTPIYISYGLVGVAITILLGLAIAKKQKRG